MSRPWWQTRDPDIPRDRATKALGRRDWGWFTTYDGSNLSPADIEPADVPWGAHAVNVKDRHDRTLGIPSREISMWPGHRPTPPAARDAKGRARQQEQVEEILADLATIGSRPPPVDVTADELGYLLRELAPRVHGRSPSQQFNEVSALARTRDIPTTTLLNLARQTGTLIARTTHRPAPDAAGENSLNRLLGTDLDLAGELLLARATLANAVAYSDPDLPRLWILANALHHAVPARILTTQPAHSHGPMARIVPTHDDLVTWPGITHAVEQLRATLDAAREGRHWIEDHAASGPLMTEDRLLALGVLHLTYPRTAHELALTEPTSVDASALRQIVAKLPAIESVSEFSDGALKAACDRNGWLLGTADERTHRELVERHITSALGDDIRADLAAGATTTLTAALTTCAPSDQDLDQATWRHDPPAARAVQSRQLLDLSSREAIHRFAGVQLEPRPSKAAALLARFPDRVSQRGLHIDPRDLIAEPVLLAPRPSFMADQPELDLGI